MENPKVEVDGHKATCGYWTIEAIASLEAHAEYGPRDVLKFEATPCDEPSCTPGGVLTYEVTDYDTESLGLEEFVPECIALPMRIYNDETDDYEWTVASFPKAVLHEIAVAALRALSKGTTDDALHDARKMIPRIEAALRGTAPEPVTDREVTVRDALRDVLYAIMPEGHAPDLDTK